MAVDEILLQVAERYRRPILRFYSWSEPTLSLGFFQRFEDRKHHSASRSSAVVRRKSGGGAILHDHELTYSLAIPAEHPFAGALRLSLYETVHRIFIEVLHEMKIETRLFSDLSIPIDPHDKEKFLCFQRYSSGDVVYINTEGKKEKILGSAQYRNAQGSVLQHGSLLWDRSSSAPELPGIIQLAVHKPDPNVLRNQLEIRMVDELFGRADELPNEIEKDFGQSIDFLQQARYAGEAWTCRK